MAAAVCKRSETVSSEGLSSLDRLVCDQEVFRGRGARRVWVYVLETNYLGPGNDWQYGFQPPHADALAVMDEVRQG